jgi:large subunit ribosomal protein L4
VQLVATLLLNQRRRAKERIMELDIVGGGKLSVAENVFAREYSEDLVHQVVTAYQAAGRAGTKAQKTRAEVTGTTKKFKKQKGGGARHGDYRAPIFVGGGVTFAARPRSFAQKVNRKMYRGALQVIFSELIRQDRLRVVESLDVASPKTKGMVEKLKALGVSKALLISEEVGKNLFLAARNVPHLALVDVAGVDPVSLITAKHVVITSGAVKKVQEWLS